MDGQETRRLRDVLGCYPTGVAIVTTRAADGRAVGLTINSFASLSLAPPLVLWSLVNHSPNLAVFRDCQRFAIHVLGSDHEPLARRFASPKVVDKFEGVALESAADADAETDATVAANAAGLPLLADVAARLICRVHHQDTLGDHRLFIGEVEHLTATPAPPLVFHGGRFTRLAEAG